MGKNMFKETIILTTVAVVALILHRLFGRSVFISVSVPEGFDQAYERHKLGRLTRSNRR